MTLMTMIAMTHGSIAATKPRPAPSMVRRMLPAHSTKSAKEKPVVVSNNAELEAMREFSESISFSNCHARALDR